MIIKNGKPTYTNENGWYLYYDGETWIATDTQFNKTGQWFANGCDAPSCDYGERIIISGFTGAVSDSNGTYNISGKVKVGLPVYIGPNDWRIEYSVERGGWSLINGLEPDVKVCVDGTGVSPLTFDGNHANSTSDFSGQSVTATFTAAHLLINPKLDHGDGYYTKPNPWNPPASSSSSLTSSSSSLSSISSSNTSDSSKSSVSSSVSSSISSSISSSHSSLSSSSMSESSSSINSNISSSSSSSQEKIAFCASNGAITQLLGTYVSKFVGTGQSEIYENGNGGYLYYYANSVWGFGTDINQPPVYRKTNIDGGNPSSTNPWDADNSGQVRYRHDVNPSDEMFIALPLIPCTTISSSSMSSSSAGPICLERDVTVTVANGYYNFDSLAANNGAVPFLLGKGAYTLTNVPVSHPIAVKESNNAITYSGTNLVGSKNGFGTSDSYNYYSGDVTITVNGDFGTTSFECLYHGAMGGTDHFVFSDSCTKPLPDGLWVKGFTGSVLSANGTYEMQPNSILNGRETYTNNNGWFMFWDGAAWIISNTAYNKLGLWVAGGAQITDIFSNANGHNGFIGQVSDAGQIESIDISGLASPYATANGIFVVDGNQSFGRYTYTNSNGWFLWFDGYTWVLSDVAYDKSISWLTNGSNIVDSGTFSTGMEVTGFTGTKIDANGYYRDTGKVDSLGVEIYENGKGYEMVFDSNNGGWIIREI